MTKRDDLPWHSKTLTRRTSALGAKLPDLTVIFNRHGDQIATVFWAPDADYIIGLTEPASGELINGRAARAFDLMTASKRSKDKVEAARLAQEARDVWEI